MTMGARALQTAHLAAFAATPCSRCGVACVKLLHSASKSFAPPWPARGGQTRHLRGIFRAASCELASPRRAGEGNSQFSRAHMNPPRCTRSTSPAQTQYRCRPPSPTPSPSCRISSLPPPSKRPARQGPGCRNCLLLKTAPPCPGTRDASAKAPIGTLLSGLGDHLGACFKSV
jgi:hypothetical protein